MNLNCHRWAAERAVEQEGSVEAAIALYNNLAGEVFASDPCSLPLLKAHECVLAQLRLIQEVRK
jgi:hypothetical protein